MRQKFPNIFYLMQAKTCKGLGLYFNEDIFCKTLQNMHEKVK